MSWRTMRCAPMTLPPLDVGHHAVPSNELELAWSARWFLVHVRSITAVQPGVDLDTLTSRGAHTTLATRLANKGRIQ
ncbi:hypothetical protein E4U55_006644 [Claviceps digitariae]|nr:hypothetical protein E4U55_006644 [Claviceps digitariae]